MRNFMSIGLAVFACLGLVKDTDAASISILSTGQHNAIVVMSDAAGGNLVISLERDSTDEYWQADFGGSSLGIIFGNASPTLPNVLRARERGLLAHSIVREFDISIAHEHFDDFTVYHLGGGDMAIALHNDGMVTSIHYVGAFLQIIKDVNPDLYCNRWKSGCCRKKWVEVGIDGVGDPIYQFIPDPYLPSCHAVIASCSAQAKADACACLNEACFCEYCTEDKHEQACLDHCNLCDDNCDTSGGGPDIDVIELFEAMATFLALANSE